MIYEWCGGAQLEYQQLMSETKCQVFPSGQVSWHQWKQGAVPGDLCQCGQQSLDPEDVVSRKLVEVTAERDTLQSKLTEVEECLRWASDNVWLQRWPERSHEERWTAYPLGISKWHNAPTLYDALYQAWKERKP